MLNYANSCKTPHPNLQIYAELFIPNESQNPHPYVETHPIIMLYKTQQSLKPMAHTPGV